MKLYYIERNNDYTWDEYDSAVVAADSDVDAGRTCPCGEETCDKMSGPPDHWVKPELVVVWYIGTAEPGVEAGVVCSSFNAG